jgi:glycosyltransferase involved in cell wall biosynthesis
MRILLVNKYFYAKGGSEVSMFETARLLKDKGHEVMYFCMKSHKNYPCAQQDYFVSEIKYDGGMYNKISSSLKLLYSFEAKNKIESLIKEYKPDLAHLNNIYHQLSPSIIHSLKKYNIPIVMTLHDYKIVCASYSLISRGRACDACKEGKYYQCLLRGCVKDSRLKSLLNTIEMYLHHKLLNIYGFVDVFISPYSNYFENKIIEMGFNRGIVHLQNFVKLEDYHPQFSWGEDSIVYFGRLSVEKGVLTLINAVKNIKGVFLKIIGEGPIKEKLEMFVKSEGIKNVVFIGYLQGEYLKNEIKKSMFAVVPSEWYEPFALTIIEAFALGKPVIGSRIGGIPERVRHGETGLLFEPGNSEELMASIEYLRNCPEEIVGMGKRGRALVEKEFNYENHYEHLMKIYQSAISKDVNIYWGQNE